MRTPVDATLRREAARYRLRFGCGDCAHFDPETGGCAEGYPNHAHRDVLLDAADALEFCKSFELG
jgi:hypothetical protein